MTLFSLLFSSDKNAFCLRAERLKWTVNLSLNKQRTRIEQMHHRDSPTGEEYKGKKSSRQLNLNWDKSGGILSPFCRFFGCLSSKQRHRFCFFTTEILLHGKCIKREQQASTARRSHNFSYHPEIQVESDIRVAWSKVGQTPHGRWGRTGRNIYETQGDN